MSESKRKEGPHGTAGVARIGLTLAAIFVLAAAGSPRAAVRLQGAGATFPYPIYAQWIHAYNELTGVEVNYQSIGSGGGIAQIKAGTVDFGASDAPLQPRELEEAGLVQFPMILGGVAVVFRLEGVASGDLRLSREVLAGIFLGELKSWNDPRIAADNPGLDLPGRAITVVHRADGSGTTWIFTNYLDKISPVWHERVGFGKAIDWPAGIGGKGNEGVAAYVQRIPGSIGYVEYAYAVQNALPVALLENRQGRFVAPTMDTFQAAARHANWEEAPGFYLVLTDQPGEESWPITGASFILLRRQQRDCGKARAMLEYFDWCYRHGAEMAVRLHYVPIPERVAELVERSWAERIRCTGKPVWP
jgi:phosphate transport system substrate-binding protein